MSLLSNRITILSLLAGLPAITVPAMANANNTLCIMPIGKDEASFWPGNKLPAFSIRVNNGKQVKVDEVRPLPVAVPSGDRHLIRIYAEGRLAESFYFRFSDYRSRVVKLVNDTTGYQTWRLMAAKSCR